MASNVLRRTGAGVALWLLGMCGAGGIALAAPSAAEIVRKADEVRFPSDGFQVDVTITTTQRSGDKDVRDYRILSKGNDRTLVLTMAPAVDRGQILLMREHDLWLFLPSVSQPVRLPMSQKLAGQVANGDLARANFAGDYEASLLRTETIEGKDYYVLDLQAARRGVTYHRVHYWVREGDFHPYKAEFFTVSNRLLKRCLYQDFETMGGAVRPARLVMQDLLRSGEVSVMDYKEMALRELPDKVFTKDYLKRLQ